MAPPSHSQPPKRFYLVVKNKEGSMRGLIRCGSLEAKRIPDFRPLIRIY